MDQFGDKKHDPTEFRREQARKEGQVPKSQDLASAVLLLGALCALLWFGPALRDFFVGYTTNQLSEAWVTLDRDSVVTHWVGALTGLATALVPLLGLLLIVAVAVNVGQVGFLFLPQKLTFDFSRLSLLKGVGRMFSLTNAVRLAFGLFKITVIATVGVWSLWEQREEIIGLASMSAIEIGAFIAETTIWTCIKIGVALLILALLDFAYQKWKHEQDLKMTDQEMREEMKMLQGDPQVIARRRIVQRQLIMNRMNQIVPQATGVVSNPTELAIAIKYDHETMPAPVVIAKGAGVLAQRIRRIALENDIPVVERKDLARLLYDEVEVNHPVPAEQYAAVAEVLRYIYELKGLPLPGAA
ncbi:MAG: EscU/YscU/HrcU family type III secretion system export apparatus switch protein [Pirellulaceae bacterium]|jgi:flagellar biosynthetic protein FlhB|nr:EscU/YscU/HrcU family type III secretion system export apparatus switch protein [Pirellulaceae bacterium]MDP7014400.1 EscU/YscU/HrcU family type III secretion system export apparatus switch protein [Pirellulaceae bacterium]